MVNPNFSGSICGPQVLEGAIIAVLAAPRQFCPNSAALRTWNCMWELRRSQRNQIRLCHRWVRRIGVQITTICEWKDAEQMTLPWLCHRVCNLHQAALLTHFPSRKTVPQHWSPEDRRFQSQICLAFPGLEVNVSIEPLSGVETFGQKFAEWTDSQFISTLCFPVHQHSAGQKLWKHKAHLMIKCWYTRIHQENYQTGLYVMVHPKKQ